MVAINPKLDPNRVHPQPPVTDPFVFDPTPQQVASIIRDYFDTTLSLIDIAHRHNTNLAALSTWATRPEIQAQFDRIEDATSRHVRLCALKALADIATAHHPAPQSQPVPPPAS